MRIKVLLVLLRSADIFRKRLFLCHDAEASGDERHVV
jgi:hypothetical protein